MGKPGGLREAVLIKHQDINDTIKYLETKLLILSLTIDKSNQNDINRFNELEKTYKDLVCLDFPKIPRNKAGKPVNIDDEMVMFTSKFRKKQLTMKIGKPIKNLFDNIGLKDLYNKFNEETKSATGTDTKI